MAIKMSMTCTRCHREDIHEIENLATATAFEELQKRKVATLAKLEAFIATLPPDELPDFFALVGEGEKGSSLMVHEYLCDPVEDKSGKGKRSCAKRVGELLEGVAELGPRQPRVKKDKPAEKPAA